MKQNCYRKHATDWQRMIRIYLLLFILILISGCANSLPKEHISAVGHSAGSSSTDPESRDDLIRRGYLYLASGNPALAKMLFLRAQEQDPSSSEAFIGIGEVEYQSGNYTNAYATFAKASTLAPDNYRALLGKARALRQQNKLNAAITEVNAAMTVAPDEVAVLTELAVIYDLMGNETLSAPIYQEILTRVPDRAASNNNIGLNFLTEKQYDQAILAFQRALDLDSSDPRIKNNLATALALNGNEEMAINLFKTTVGEAGAYNNLGYIYMTQKLWDQAERALRMALASNPVHYQKAQENLDRLKQQRQFQPTDEI